MKKNTRPQQQPRFPDTWLGRIRKKVGVSQAHFAHALGLQRRSYYKSEKQPEPIDWQAKLLLDYSERYGVQPFKDLVSAVDPATIPKD